MANRSRRYVTGVGGGLPLPLSVADIADVLESQPNLLPRAELDLYVLALDDEFLDSINGKPKPKQPQDVEAAFDALVAKLNRKTEED